MQKKANKPTNLHTLQHSLSKVYVELEPIYHAKNPKKPLKSPFLRASLTFVDQQHLPMPGEPLQGRVKILKQLSRIMDFSNNEPISSWFWWLHNASNASNFDRALRGAELSK